MRPSMRGVGVSALFCRSVMANFRRCFCYRHSMGPMFTCSLSHSVFPLSLSPPPAKLSRLQIKKRLKLRPRVEHSGVHQPAPAAHPPPSTTASADLASLSVHSSTLSPPPLSLSKMPFDPRLLVSRRPPPPRVPI